MALHPKKKICSSAEDGKFKKRATIIIWNSAISPSELDEEAILLRWNGFGSRISNLR